MASTFERSTISAESAQEIIRLCREKAASDGGAYCLAIVDESGVLKAFERMDGAPLICVQISQDKAYTAAGFGLLTDGWFDFIKDDPALQISASSSIDRLVPFGGGYPIRIDGALVGGLGVSGGHYSDDMGVAQAGLAELP